MKREELPAEMATVQRPAIPPEQATVEVTAITVPQEVIAGNPKPNPELSEENARLQEENARLGQTVTELGDLLDAQSELVQTEEPENPANSEHTGERTGNAAEIKPVTDEPENPANPQPVKSDAQPPKTEPEDQPKRNPNGLLRFLMG